MTPYPHYIKLSHCWLEKKPVNWELKKLRSILKPISKKNRPDLPLLSVVREKGVIVRNILNRGENHNSIPEDLTNYKIVKCGNFAMNKMKAWQGSYGVSEHEGIVSPAYYVFELEGVEPGFFHYAVRSKAYVPFFGRASDGIRVGQWDLNLNRMREIPFLIPNSKEQQKISLFLDWQTSKINKFIKAKQKLIELLKEQKQVIINRAVTKGLNPNVKMKDSGIEWLGEIPEHWETKKIKQLASFNPSKSESIKENNIDNEVVFLPMGKISIDGEIDCSIKLPIKKIKDGFTYFRKGDVVIAKITPCFENGKGASLSNLASEFGFGTTELIVLRPIDQVLGSYLRLIFSSKSFLGLGAQFMIGAAGQKRIPVNFVRNFELGIPSLTEQNEIINKLKIELEKLNKVLQATKIEISLMQEYKNRLVSDIVTGKVDVRNIEIPEFEKVDEQTLPNEEEEENLEEMEA